MVETVLGRQVVIGTTAKARGRETVRMETGCGMV